MTSAHQRDLTAHLLVVANATAATAQLLSDDGIEAIVIRGPALAHLLYPAGPPRISIDVDLLVPDLEWASAVVCRGGYRLVVDWTPGFERHAWTHVKEGAVSLDLHRTLVGVGADPANVWATFRRESRIVELAGRPVRVPTEAGSVTIVALHAAQHGAGDAKTIGDLDQALRAFDRNTWSEAAKLAGELAAVPAFRAGLELLPNGAELARALDLGRDGTVTTRLRVAAAPPTALGLDHLRRQRGHRARARFLGRKLVPPVAFMRDWHGVARRGRLGLALAYGYRLLWLVRWLPAGVRALWRARRSPRFD